MYFENNKTWNWKLGDWTLYKDLLSSAFYITKQFNALQMTKATMPWSSAIRLVGKIIILRSKCPEDKVVFERQVMTSWSSKLVSSKYSLLFVVAVVWSVYLKCCSCFSERYLHSGSRQPKRHPQKSGILHHWKNKEGYHSTGQVNYSWWNNSTPVIENWCKNLHQ
jgi:hypothetical protein